MDQVMEEVHNNDLFRGGALLTLLGSIAYVLKEVPIRIVSRIDRLARYRTTIDETSSGRLYEAFALWYAHNYPGKLRNTIAAFVQDTELNSIESKKRSFSTRYTHKADVTWIWDRLFPMVISKERNKMEHSSYTSERYEEVYMISAFFGKRRILRMINEVKDWYEAYLEERREDIYVNIGRNSGGKYISSYKSFDKIYHQCAASIRADIDEYERRKDFYTSMGIRNKRSFLFWGPGGTGKTSIALAIAGYTKRDIHILNLATLSGDDALNNFITDVTPHSVILLEDIHTWFEKKKQTVSLSGLLNVLDGILSPEDVIIIATANRLGAIDPAFLRTGRMDVVMEIGPASPEWVSKYVSDFYGVEVTINKSLTMSDVQEACLRTKDVLSLSL